MFWELYSLIIRSKLVSKPSLISASSIASRASLKLRFRTSTLPALSKFTKPWMETINALFLNAPVISPVLDSSDWLLPNIKTSPAPTRYMRGAVDNGSFSFRKTKFDFWSSCTALKIAVRAFSSVKPSKKIGPIPSNVMLPSGPTITD